jgi:ABC-2 type transport system permease protein
MGRVARRELAGRARSLAWWTLGLLALAAINIVFWPTISDQQEELTRLVEGYPEALVALFAGGGALDLASEAGFLDSQLYAFMFPVVLLIHAIGFGASASAGEEDRGTIELLLANPLSRRRLVAEKAGALAATLAGLGAVVFLAVWLGGRAVGLEIGAGRVAAATLALVLLALAFGALALALGSATGNRGLALGVSAAVALGAYLLQSLGPLVDVLEPWTPLSPFAHYAAGDRLREGFDARAAAVLLGLAFAFALAAAESFARRDLRL